MTLEYNEISENTKVNHPSYYTWLKDLCGIEVIDITRHMNFNLGNVIKYVLRAGRKTEQGYSGSDKETEDLLKARWYLTDELKLRGVKFPEDSEIERLKEQLQKSQKIIENFAQEAETKEFTLSKHEILNAAEIIKQNPNISSNIDLIIRNCSFAPETSMFIQVNNPDGTKCIIAEDLTNLVE